MTSRVVTTQRLYVKIQYRQVWECDERNTSWDKAIVLLFFSDKRQSYIHFYWYFDSTIERNNCDIILYHLKVMAVHCPCCFFSSQRFLPLNKTRLLCFLLVWLHSSSSMYNYLLLILAVSFIAMLSCLQCVMNILLKVWTFVLKQISIPVFMYLEDLCIKCTGWTRQ